MQPLEMNRAVEPEFGLARLKLGPGRTWPPRGTREPMTRLFGGHAFCTYLCAEI